MAIASLFLVCADDVWARRTHDVLSADGFDVEIDPDGLDVLDRISAHQPDLVGVDLSLPANHGAALCASLRTRSTIAIFAVGPRASEVNTVAALSAGADAFIPKEVSPRELVARVRALLRRFPRSPTTDPSMLVCGPVELDPVRRRATVSGRHIDLDEAGLDLLEALLRKPGRVVSRVELLAACGAKPTDDRALELHVRRLRERLEADTSERWISAVRGVGFRFEVDGGL